ncbi:hypothetical protein EVA_06258 [gut metagenome]|uniref:Uncharacterized protein n=1 Tax=gut metagenome TaxID=749906 RepID=J9GXY9_9ZZZZ
MLEPRNEINDLPLGQNAHHLRKPRLRVDRHRYAEPKPSRVRRNLDALQQKSQRRAHH